MPSWISARQSATPSRKRATPSVASRLPAATTRAATGWTATPTAPPVAAPQGLKVGWVLLLLW